MLTGLFQECSRIAFAKKGRSLQASDLTDEVYTAFMNIFGEGDDDDNNNKNHNNNNNDARL